MEIIKKKKMIKKINKKYNHDDVTLKKNKITEKNRLDIVFPIIPTIIDTQLAEKMDDDLLNIASSGKSNNVNNKIMNKSIPLVHNQNNENTVVMSLKSNKINKKPTHAKNYDINVDNQIRRMSITLRKIIDKLATILTIICKTTRDNKQVQHLLSEIISLYDKLLDDFAKTNMALLNPFIPKLNKFKLLVVKMKHSNYNKMIANNIIVDMNKQQSQILNIFTVYENSVEQSKK